MLTVAVVVTGLALVAVDANAVFIVELKPVGNARNATINSGQRFAATSVCDLGRIARESTSG